jgi:hypothetical protein
LGRSYLNPLFSLALIMSAANRAVPASTRVSATQGDRAVQAGKRVHHNMPAHLHCQQAAGSEVESGDTGCPVVNALTASIRSSRIGDGAPPCGVRSTITVTALSANTCLSADVT